VARIGVKKHAYRLLVEKSERNGYHGRFMRRWEDIKIDRKCCERTCREFIVEYGQVAGFCEHGNETLGYTEVLIFSHRMSHQKTLLCILFLCWLTLRRLMSYIYGAPILDVSRSHTMTQHSR